MLLGSLMNGGDGNNMSVFAILVQQTPFRRKLIITFELRAFKIHFCFLCLRRCHPATPILTAITFELGAFKTKATCVVTNDGVLFANVDALVEEQGGVSLNTNGTPRKRQGPVDRTKICTSYTSRSCG